MGTDYNIFNHEKAAYFELGKGPWYLISEKIWVLYDAEICAIELNDVWGDHFSADSEEEKLRYFSLLAGALREFVGETPQPRIQIFGDGGDEHCWAYGLRYECAGTRFQLNDPVVNRELIELDNVRHRSSLYDLNAQEIEQLRLDGWNIKNIQR